VKKEQRDSENTWARVVKLPVLHPLTYFSAISSPDIVLL